MGLTLSSSVIPKRPVFPLHELFISAFLLILIALALYFWGGAWGMVILWGLALLFVLPMIGAAIALLINGREELAKGRQAVAYGSFLGGLLLAITWAAGLAYVGYRGYLAIP